MPRLGLRKLREQNSPGHYLYNEAGLVAITDHGYSDTCLFRWRDHQPSMNRPQRRRVTRALNGDTSKRRRTLVRNFYRQYPHLRSASRAQLIAAFERREAGLPVVCPGDAKRAREAAEKRRRKAAERTGAYVSEDLTKLSVKAREAYGMRDRFVKRTGIPL